jgi:hypothetical protein
VENWRKLFGPSNIYGGRNSLILLFSCTKSLSLFFYVRHQRLHFSSLDTVLLCTQQFRKHSIQKKSPYQGTESIWPRLQLLSHKTAMIRS